MRQEVQLGMFDDQPQLGMFEDEQEVVVEVIKAPKPAKQLINYADGVDTKLLEVKKIDIETLVGTHSDTYNGVLVEGVKNSVQVTKNLFWIRSVLKNIIGEDLMREFSILQKSDKRIRYVIPISGGADSTGIALILRALFPEIPFTFVFTDTLAESPDLYYQLERVEEYLGIKINRIVPKLGLYQSIEDKNGFMPNQKARWCTPELKIVPMLKVMEENYDPESVVVHQYVGIRFDENRGAMVAEDKGIYTHMPYMNLRMSKSDVYRLLNETVGLPDFYRYKTRSGCMGCFFMRRSEKSAQLFHKPDEFAFVSSKEKITYNDRAKYGLYWNDTYRKAVFKPGFSVPFSNSRLLYSVPEFVDVRTRNEPMMSLQPDANPLRERIFVGVAMYAPRSNYGCNNHMVYKTEFAVYSNRKHNLVDQMLTWYAHERTNYLLKGFDSPEEMEQDINLICFELELPADLGKALKSKTDEKSFTNSKGEAYAQIECITKIAHTVLTYERTLQDFNEYKRYLPTEPNEFDVYSVNEDLAMQLQKDLTHQTEIMKMLNLPSVVAHKIETPSERELLLRERKRGKNKKKGGEKNMEAVEACTICSI